HRFPELKHLVIQVRRKKAASGEQRFYSEILPSPPLRPTVEKLGLEHIRRRVTIVEGDLSEPFCGLSAEQLARLEGKVDVVVNTAGLVEFDPPLNESLLTNVYGIQNLIELVKLLNARLVHISTCYVAGKQNGRVSEQTPIVGYYPRRVDADDTSFDVRQELAWCENFIRDTLRRANLAEAIEEPIGKVRTPRQVREELRQGGMSRAEHWGWINTYTYTKSMGEQLIAGTPGLRYGIVRPAIVESALGFPFPGWNEGLTTSAPLVLMGGEGVKSWPVRRDGPLEIIPVDLVATGILIATAATLGGKNKPVYHLATASDNAVMLPRLVAFLGMNARYKHKHKKTGNRLANLWKTYVETQVVSVEQLQARRVRLHRGLDVYHAFLNLLKSLLGAKIVDPYLRSLRATRRQIRQQEQTLDQFLPFMIYNTFVFETGNIRAAYNQLSDEDRARLVWDPENIDWADYWVNIHTKGIEKWIRPVFVKAGKRPEGAAVPL
ncbi:MAG: SDR family oxidoreductase, partial [Acidobacteria bacterium]|nr:SDR family oxidoreductase [Acidobacteriota bacterium]